MEILLLKNMIDGKLNPAYYRGHQSGGGIANMYSKRLYMIPVNLHVTTEAEQKIVVGKEVTPTAAVEDRARSEFKETIQDGAPHVPLGIKRQKPKHPVISRPASKLSSSSNYKTKKLTKQGSISKAEKPSDKKRKRKNSGTNRKTQKRKFSELTGTKDDNNVFSKVWRS
ncbi:MAG: hypothetical protein AB2693_34750 [Candidatus Thiodiazotropha sp.]